MERTQHVACTSTKGPADMRVGMRRNPGNSWPWLALMVALGVALPLLWRGEEQQRDALNHMQAPQRQALFRHTRAIVEDACQAAPPPLQDHCRAQAELLLKFPECDSQCRDLARRAIRLRRGLE